MAVKTCKECGNQVSTKAKKCPNCGAKAPKQTSILAWALVGIIGYVFYMVGQGKLEAPAPRAASSESTTEKQQQKPQAVASKLDMQREKVQKLFQGNDEPRAKDALWTSHDVFKVGVIDDGTSRDGYASYVCQVLYEHGFKGQKVWVQIIDIVKLTRNNDWVKLGESHCE